MSRKKEDYARMSQALENGEYAAVGPLELGFEVSCSCQGDPDDDDR